MSETISFSALVVLIIAFICFSLFWFIDIMVNGKQLVSIESMLSLF